MKRFILLSTCVTALSAGITGCSTMNSEFSCNATAGDSCLTIEQVDDMTRFTDTPFQQRNRSVHAPSLERRNSMRQSHAPVMQMTRQGIWLAPSTTHTG